MMRRTKTPLESPERHLPSGRSRDAFDLGLDRRTRQGRSAHPPWPRMHLPPTGISDLIMPTRFRSLTLLTVMLVFVSRAYSQTDEIQLPALMAEAKRAQT